MTRTIIVCSAALLASGCATSHTPLSAATKRRVEILFREPDRAEAKRLLVEECGRNIPNFKAFDARGLERFRFAALKLSGGDLRRLRDAVELAKLDSRDLLMAAEFQRDVRQHERCTPTNTKSP